MKRKDRESRYYGLRVRFGLSLLASALLCIIVFFVVDLGLDSLFNYYLEHSDYERLRIQKQYESLQRYIDLNSISSEDLGKLKAWEKSQPVILLELYADDVCIYSSIYDVPVSSLVLDESLDTDNDSAIRLKDIDVEAFLYSDFMYECGVIKIAIASLLSLVVFVISYIQSSKKMIRYICRLNEEVQIIEGGNLEYCVSEEGNDEITDLARSMNRMRTTLANQIESEQHMYQANRKLITEMSHDLRTPLTSILLYLEILRSHRYNSEEELQNYLEIIDTKAHHMKLLSDHLFEYSMDNSKVKTTQLLSMETAFLSAVKVMKNDLSALGFCVEENLKWEKCYVKVNPEYISRILENVTSNIEKYGEKKALVRIDTLHYGKFCGFSVMNTLKNDTSFAESNGVGIDSIKNMIKQMGGKCSVEQTDSTFEITLMFPVE